MTITIEWAEDDDIEQIRQRGRAQHVRIVMDGVEYTMSFMTIDTMRRLLDRIDQTDAPFCFRNWVNFIVLQDINEQHIEAAVEYLKEYGELGGYVTCPP